VRHEIVDFYSAVFTVRIRVQGSQQCKSALTAHTEMQRTTLCPVFPPAHEFWIAQVFLRFANGATAYTIQNELVPELF
jgi:hypothetical protein